MEGLERRLAVLCGDVAGSTRLYERLGKAEALHAVDRCIKRMERVVRSVDGRMVRVVGHEMMATFDSAEEACLAAMEMQRQVADLPPVSGVKMAVRIGVHVGPVAKNENNELTGDIVENAVRLAKLAAAEQILATIHAVAELPDALREEVEEVAQPALKAGIGQVFQVHWHKPEAPAAARPIAVPLPDTPKDRLCLRYRGRAYLLDGKTPLLSLGRDPSNDVVVEDRKASRQHGRIERRGDKFVFIDRSSNGSYVTSGGEREVMVRHSEILLEGEGTICFGSSINDPKADCARFEQL